jgi:transcriptional regulator with XRE-family HTH domain
MPKKRLQPKNDPKFFRAYRKRIGVTQHQLAKLSGVDYSIIANMEAGRRRLTDDIGNLLWKALEDARDVRQRHLRKFDRLAEATAKYPDAEEKIKAATTDIMAKAPAFMQAFINESEVTEELLYVLADATTLNNVLEAAKTSPGKAMRVLHDMELEIQKELSKPRKRLA